MVSGGEDKTIRLWDVRSGEQLGIVEGFPEAVSAVALADFADGAVVVAGDRAGTVAIWQTRRASGVVSLDVGCPVVAVAAPSSGSVAIAADRGLLVLEVPTAPEG